MRKKILLIATGGTIASRDNGNGLSPSLTSEDLLRYVPEINGICDVDAIQLLSIDSTNIQPEHWLLIGDCIHQNYNAYDGFIITHGTDTMAYTAAALSYLIQTPNKPIILTGAQKPIGAPISDASKNLLDSFRFATEEGVAGVYLVFSGIAILGTRAKKTKTKSYAAFESINFPAAAFIDDRRIVRYLKNESTSLEQQTTFYDTLSPSVFLLKLIPGIHPNILDFIGEKYDAVVIESYGVGGLPFAHQRNFLTSLDTLTKKGKIVVLSTQVVSEGSDVSVYEVGLNALKNYNVLQSYDMTIEATVTKLMWILGRTKEYRQVRELFYTRIHEDLFL